MKSKQRRNHVIDFLFPVALLLVFAICAILVVLMATRIYRSTVNHSSLNYTSETSLAYIAEKIHQNDQGGDIYLGELDGTPALVMEREYDGELYYTYIYEADGQLSELYLKDGIEAGVGNGTAIIPVQEFSMTQVTDRLFRFTCTDEAGNSTSALVGVRSK